MASGKNQDVFEYLPVRIGYRLNDLARSLQDQRQESAPRRRKARRQSLLLGSEADPFVRWPGPEGMRAPDFDDVLSKVAAKRRYVHQKPALLFSSVRYVIHKKG